VSCFPTTKYCGLLFGVQNSNNLYLAQIVVPDGNLNLFIKSGGSYTALNQNKSASLPSNERIRVEVDWTTSGFTVTAIDNIGNVIADVSSTNTVYSSGGIGFRGDTGVAYDYARIL
jgi:hypothetical protein